MMNGQVLTYLLGDAWGVGRQAPGLAHAAGGGRAAQAGRVHGRLPGPRDERASASRSVSQVRDRVQSCSTRGASSTTTASRGARFYEFGESAQVLNNAVNATVLFLDLRGFTQTSEGQISERDLTRELYTVFDAFIPIVARFGGTVDKFLGDGMMITYGTEQGGPARSPERGADRHPLSGDAAPSMRERGRPTSRWGSPSTTAASTWPASSPTRRRCRPR